VFQQLQSLLAAGSLLIFSVEDMDEKDYQAFPAGFHLRLTARFAHHSSYIESLAKQFGFKQLARRPLALRLNRNEPVPGSIYTLIKI